MGDYISYLLDVLVLCLAFPAGVFLSHLCKDELVDFRYWFGRLKFLFVILGIFLLFVPYYRLSLSFSMFFLAVIFTILEYKGFKKAGRK